MSAPQDDRDIHIVNLLDAPETLPALVRWYGDAWMPWYGPDGEGDAESDLQACAHRDALPVCLVALNESGGLLGTAALREESVGSEHGEGPWLAALLVGEIHRGQGVGRALIAAITAEARRLGFAWLYTSTEAADSMARHGWQPVGKTESLRGEIAVYRREL